MSVQTDDRALVERIADEWTRVFGLKNHELAAELGRRDLPHRHLARELSEQALVYRKFPTATDEELDFAADLALTRLGR